MPDIPIEKIEQQTPVDKKPEKIAEQAPEIPEVEEVPQVKPQKAAKALPITEEQKDKAALKKSEELVMIENVLSENIKDLYSQLSGFKQKAFQKKGEEVALKIKIILEGTKIRANEVFELIMNWLKMLPKISSYFLEQEAKIKTDNTNTKNANIFFIFLTTFLSYEIASFLSLLTGIIKNLLNNGK